MATCTLVYHSNSGFRGQPLSRRGISSSPASASTSRGQHEQPASERAAKRLLPHRAPHSLVVPEEPASKRQPLSGRPPLGGLGM
eukprot:2836330-Alexandrium_andersonii.AAC.1